jgi:hypothetical protein
MIADCFGRWLKSWATLHREALKLRSKFTLPGLTSTYMQALGIVEPLRNDAMIAHITGYYVPYEYTAVSENIYLA